MIKMTKEKGMDLTPYPSGSHETFAADFDAYYGNASPPVPEFAAAKKPVLIADLGL